MNISRLVLNSGIAFLTSVSTIELLAGCFLLEQVLKSSTSPDGCSEVEVQELSHFNDSLVYIRLKQRFSRKDVQFEDDRWPRRPEIYWRHNKVVGVLICDKLGGNIIYAFDFDLRRTIPSEFVRGGIASQIQKKILVSGSIGITQ